MSLTTMINLSRAMIYSDIVSNSVNLEESRRVVASSVSLDMVEVASSNLAGPTKY